MYYNWLAIGYDNSANKNNWWAIGGKDLLAITTFWLWLATGMTGIYDLHYGSDLLSMTGWPWPADNDWLSGLAMTGKCGYGGLILLASGEVGLVSR